MIRRYTEVIPDIQDKFKNGSYRELVLFVGSGTSTPLEHPSWKSLIDDFHKAMECTKEMEEIRKEFGNDYSLLAEDILKNSNKDYADCINFIEEKFKDSTHQYTDIHDALIRYFNKIITTNYDRAFENVIQTKLNDDTVTESFKETLQYEFIDYPDNVIASRFEAKKRVLVHLHGKVGNGAFVFLKRDYDFAYVHSNDISKLLISILRRYPLFFVGFSFDDLAFRNNLHRLIKEEEVERKKGEALFGKRSSYESIIGIYVLLKEDKIDSNRHEQAKRLIDYFNELNIEIVTYSEEHSIVRSILEQLKYPNAELNL